PRASRGPQGNAARRGASARALDDPHWRLASTVRLRGKQLHAQAAVARTKQSLPFELRRAYGSPFGSQCDYAVPRAPREVAQVAVDRVEVRSQPHTVWRV